MNPATYRIIDSNQRGQIIPSMLVNAYSVLTLPAYYRAINFLSNNLSSFPRSIRQNGAPTVTPHPLQKLIGRRPNSYQNSTQFWKALFFHTAHLGNGYARIERAGGFAPVAFHNLLPDDVVPFRWVDDSGQIGQFYAQRSTSIIYPAANIIHLSGLCYDGMVGENPVTLHAATFQRAGMLDQHITRYLQKGTVLRGSVEIPLEAGEEMVNDILNLIRTQHQGPNADKDVLVLSGGATLNNKTLSPQDSQLVEQMGMTTKQISQITGVPPHFLYDLTEGKYNNVPEQAGIDVVRWTFRPWLDQTTDELECKLLSEDERDAGFTVYFDPEALERGDSTTVTATAVAQKTAGLISTNEARGKIGLPPDSDPDSDKIKTLGDTAPPPAQAEIPLHDESSNIGEPALKSSLDNSQELYQTLAPVVANLCETVQKKTEKAFANHQGKSGEDRIIWANVFSDQQAKYTVEALTPILLVLGHKPEGIAKLGEKYASSIRKRAATGEGSTLQMILDEKVV